MEETYALAHEIRLKNVALYKDHIKAHQPKSFKKSSKLKRNLTHSSGVPVSIIFL